MNPEHIEFPAEFSRYEAHLKKDYEHFYPILSGYLEKGETVFQAIVHAADDLAHTLPRDDPYAAVYSDVALIGYFLLSEYAKVLTFAPQKEDFQTLYFKYKASRIKGLISQSNVYLSNLLNILAELKKSNKEEYKICSVIISLEIASMNADQAGVLKYSEQFKDVLFNSVLVERYPLITIQVVSDLAYREFRTGSKDYSGWLEIYKELAEAFNMDSKRLDCYTMLGGLYRYKGYLDEAAEYYSKAIDIAERIGNKEFIGSLMSNMADLEQTRGNFEKALFLCYETLKDPEITESRPSIYINIAEILIKQENYEEALRYLQKASEKSQKLQPVIYILYGYCLTHIKEEGNYHEGIKYLQRGGYLSEQTNNLRWLTMYHYFMGRTYLESYDLSSAINSFEQCYSIAITTEFQYVVLSQLYLAETYIQRYKISQAEEDLTKAQRYLANIITICQEQELPILSEILYLQGQLLLITNEYVDAESAFLHAQAIAEENNYQWLVAKIDQKLETIKSRHLVKATHVINDMTEVVNSLSKKSFFKRTEELPKLYFLFVFTTKGNYVYSHFFDKNFEFNEMLMSGLISAIQTMSSEMFGVGLRGIDFEGKHILVENTENFCGVIAADDDSFNARARLMEFLTRFEEKFNKNVEDLEIAGIAPDVGKEAEKIVNSVFKQQRVRTPI
ncbi:MAG: tetratricopeptide repeat protein [Candidatus Heimdallarchaeaceae archaeon]